MSELTAYNSERIYWAVEQVEQEAGDLDTLHLDDSLFYLKSEADKVIAEKDKEIQRLENLCESYRIDCDNLAIREANAYKEIERDNKQLRRHKYKRCLAMASNCRLRARWFGDNAFYKKEQWALQWHRRWLQLAEKFKHNTSTKGLI